ncbi:MULTISPECIES: hypothetical protein [unclassified Nitratiruptor]|uniref:hypothetical protein n=1 Tax=unclassified Nitratiruptor TaxID=2624044 RepID=UPI00191680D1|nr:MULTISPECIES: hypothetical protein [unclassified Nitratiruptor]
MVKYIDIDGNESTFNSSSAYLQLPNDYQEILWAGLFWQGNVNGVANGRYYRHQRRAVKISDTSWRYIYNSYYYNYLVDIPSTDANRILFKIDGISNYEEIVAQNLDYYKWYGDYGAVYSAFADITQLLKEKFSQFQPGEKLTITVANVTTNEGLEYSLGDYGAWTLVVVYKGGSQSTFKRVLVYNGYDYIAYPGNSKKSIDITNLYLPPSGEVKASFASFAGEGEEPYSPDHMKLENQNMPGARDPDNIFDARLANVERPNIGNNAVSNTNGIDIDVYDVSTIMTKVRNSDPSTNTVTLSLDTKWDAYFPSMIAFSVQLYQPKICYEDTLYDENGNELGTNVQLQVGQTIRTHLVIRNDDNETAQNVMVYRKFDNNTTAYVPNSTLLKDVDDTDLTPRTDYAVDNDQVFYDDANKTLAIGYLGEGNDPALFKPYSEDNSIAEIEYNMTVQNEGNITFEYETKYIFNIAGQTFLVDSIMPRCSDLTRTISAYLPHLGSFNVVNENYTEDTTEIPWETNSSINSLYTQIANKEFNITVVKLGSDFKTPEKFTGLVRLDLIETPDFSSTSSDSEKQEICTNATPLSSKIISFSGSEYNKTNFTYSSAIKDATFKITYVKDPNSNGPVEWTCANNTLECIWGMLESTVYESNQCNKGNKNGMHGNNGMGRTRNFNSNCPCADVCRPGNGTGDNQASQECLDCIFDSNLSTSVCARDRFAIRPDHYVADTNESILRGGRWYMMDINATTIDGNITHDYNQSIPLVGIDKNITVALNLPSDCNASQIRNKNMDLSSSSSISFNDGQAPNILFSYPDVGEVNITITDNEWTKVDQEPKSDGSIDCIPNSDTNIPNSGKIGCVLKTTIQKRFIPEKFDIDFTVNNFDTNFTYLSNEQNMSAKINLTFTAALANGERAYNYTAGCFARDINFTLEMNNTNQLTDGIKTLGTIMSKIRYFSTSDANMTNSNDGSGIGKFDSNESVFANGIANVTVDFNFERNVSQPVSPFQIKNTDFNISVQESNGWDVNVTGADFNRSIESNATFYYGRVFAPDYITDKKSITASIYFEVYDYNNSDPNNIEGNESIATPHWYINNQHNKKVTGEVNKLKLFGNPSKNLTNLPIDNKNIIPIPNKGKIEIPIFYSGNIFPYHVLINIYASPWLIYKKFYNSFDNNDTVSFEITFIGKTDWQGIGNWQGNDDNEENRLNKEPLQRIEW